MTNAAPAKQNAPAGWPTAPTSTSATRSPTESSGSPSASQTTSAGEVRRRLLAHAGGGAAAEARLRGEQIGIAPVAACSTSVAVGRAARLHPRHGCHRPRHHAFGGAGRIMPAARLDVNLYDARELTQESFGRSMRWRASAPSSTSALRTTTRPGARRTCTATSSRAWRASSGRRRFYLQTMVFGRNMIRRRRSTETRRAIPTRGTSR